MLQLETKKAQRPPVAVDLQQADRGAVLFSWLLGPALLLAVLISFFTGAYYLSSRDIVILLANAIFYSPEAPADAAAFHLLVHIRLPRIVMGVLVGAALAAAGAAIQGLFRNPLADPALIGVTSGGSLLAVVGIFTAGALPAFLPSWLGQSIITLLSFSGSLVTTWLVYRLATHRGRTSVVTMLLAGIALAALAGAGIGLISYFSDEAQLRDITFWTLGSISGSDWEKVFITGLPIVFALFVLLRQARALDALMLGEREAVFLGLSVQRAKRNIIFFAALAVGVSVAVTGVIAFVALVAPHLVRLISGPRHRSLLRQAAMAGALLIVLADLAARTLVAPAELPIGVLTAILGAPFFLWLLLRNRSLRLPFA